MDKPKTIEHPNALAGPLSESKTPLKPVLGDVIAESLSIHLHENTQCNQVCRIQIIKVISIFKRIFSKHFKVAKKA